MTTSDPFPRPDCLLNLACPKALEEEMLDVLATQAALVPGFTVIQAQGVGANVELVTTLEQVQGRARRVLLQIALARSSLAPLLATLRQALPSPQIAYWVVPLLDFGHFAEAA